MRFSSVLVVFSFKRIKRALIAAALLALPAVYAYSEIAKNTQCSEGQIVKINLTSKRDPEPYRLNIPCEYFRYRYLNDGAYESIQLSFFKDTKEPAWPWYEQHPEVKNSQDDEIKVRLSRAFNPNMVEDSHKGTERHDKKVDADAVSPELFNFDIYTSIHSEFPNGPYTLYPKDQRPSATEIKCIYGNCVIYDGATYYKGLGLRYEIKKHMLPEWRAIEGQVKTLVDQFKKQGG